MILDILLSLFGTIFVIESVNKILKNKSNSIGNYIMIVIYVFNCFPIILNLILGLPNYKLLPYFSPFYVASQNQYIRNIYSFYILLVMIMIRLYLYKIRYKHNIKILYTKSRSRILRGKMLLGISLAPIIYVLIIGHYKEYMIFQSSIRRGLSNSEYSILILLEYIGLFSFICWFFEYNKQKKMHSYFYILLYFFLIIWIDGKRFLIPTVIVLFLFFYTHSVYFIYKKIPLKLVISILIILFGLLYSGYTLLYKINTINSLRIIDSLYLAFRIDFGRDDVTKFVLYKEIIEKQPILNYRGESLIATFLFFIPRSLWINKPFPHYRYLTAALYNTQILDIPAGMTPSIFEMSIANFGVILGIIFTLIFLIFCIKISDNEKSIVLKAMYLIMIIGILTQSMDAMIAMIFLSVFNKLFQKLKFMGKSII